MEDGSRPHYEQIHKGTLGKRPPAMVDAPCRVPGILPHGNGMSPGRKRAGVGRTRQCGDYQRHSRVCKPRSYKGKKAFTRDLSVKEAQEEDKETRCTERDAWRTALRQNKPPQKQDEGLWVLQGNTGGEGLKGTRCWW